MQTQTDSSSIDSSNVVRPTLARRLAAMTYDAIVVFGLLLGLWIVFYFLLVGITGTEDVGGEPLALLYWPLGVMLMALFFAGFWSHGGQTLGMRAWRIKVLNEDGSPLSLGRGLLRFLLAVLSALPLGLGYLWSLFDPSRRAWHDSLSHTMLVMLAKSRG